MRFVENDSMKEFMESLEMDMIQLLYGTSIGQKVQHPSS